MKAGVVPKEGGSTRQFRLGCDQRLGVRVKRRKVSVSHEKPTLRSLALHCLIQVVVQVPYRPNGLSGI